MFLQNVSNLPPDIWHHKIILVAVLTHYGCPVPEETPKDMESTSTKFIIGACLMPFKTGLHPHRFLLYDPF
jgi:hypothetical protein